MSLSSSTYDDVRDAAVLTTDDSAYARFQRPPRPVTGPVLLGDIHPVQCGRPLLLSLWARWEEAARKG